MTNMTLAIPKELHVMMKKHPETKWSEIARQSLWNHAQKLELLNNLLSKSELTEKDAIELGKKIKTGIAKKHGFLE